MRTLALLLCLLFIYPLGASEKIREQRYAALAQLPAQEGGDFIVLTQIGQQVHTLAQHPLFENIELLQQLKIYAPLIHSIALGGDLRSWAPWLTQSLQQSPPASPLCLSIELQALAQLGFSLLEDKIMQQVRAELKPPLSWYSQDGWQGVSSKEQSLYILSRRQGTHLLLIAARSPEQIQALATKAQKALHTPQAKGLDEHSYLLYAQLPSMRGHARLWEQNGLKLHATLQHEALSQYGFLQTAPAVQASENAALYLAASPLHLPRGCWRALARAIPLPLPPSLETLFNNATGAFSLWQEGTLLQAQIELRKGQQLRADALKTHAEILQLLETQGGDARMFSSMLPLQEQKLPTGTLVTSPLPIFTPEAGLHLHIGAQKLYFSSTRKGAMTPPQIKSHPLQGLNMRWKPDAHADLIFELWGQRIAWGFKQLHLQLKQEKSSLQLEIHLKAT